MPAEHDEHERLTFITRLLSPFVACVLALGPQNTCGDERFAGMDAYIRAALAVMPIDSVAKPPIIRVTPIKARKFPSISK